MSFGDSLESDVGYGEGLSGEAGQTLQELGLIMNPHSNFERPGEQILAMGLRQMREANETLRLENIRLRHDLDLCMGRLEKLAAEIEGLKDATG